MAASLGGVFFILIYLETSPPCGPFLSKVHGFLQIPARASRQKRQTS